METESTPVAACDYCGLPLPVGGGSPERAAGTASPGERPAQYCCFGCRFAAAVAAESGEEGSARWTLVRLGLSVFFAMIVMVFSLALWSQDVYEVDDSAATRAILNLFRYACLLATVPVLLLLGGPLLENAWENWRQGRLSTDVLLVVGVVAAFAVSVRSVLLNQGGVYFEVACVVLLAVTLGRWLEATGRLKTTQALRSLEKLLPAEARIVERRQGLWVDGAAVPLAEVRVGHLLRVLPGERIAVDGVIRRGQAAIDEQVVTGESQPAVKEVGDRVLAGSLNIDGDLVIEVIAAPRDGTLQRLVNAVVEAALTRGRIQRMADRISSWFLPSVVAIAFVTFAVHSRWDGLEAGLLSSLAVLLIACPCALGIATPLAIWAAMGRAARVGVVFRDGDALHRAARVAAIAFDKTGTLTTGDPEVIEVALSESVSTEEVLDVAGRVASTSTHHLSAAIRSFCADRWEGEPGTSGSGPAVLAELTQTLPGMGVVARVGELVGDVFLGSPRWLAELGMGVESKLGDRLSAAMETGTPVACVAWNGRVRGIFVFRERLRDETPAALAELRQAGFQVSVLTGDHRARGELLARELGVTVASEQLPQDKLLRVKRLREEHGGVAMVGDGVNDAPALAAADVGIAMGCGADVSRDTADICLLGNDLRRVLWSLRLAQQAMRTIHYNLFWAFAYNAAGVAIAAAGWLNPIWAAAAMVVSSLFVITNSLRLSREGTA